MWKWKLKETLEAQGMEQSELSKKSKVNRNTICALCGGKGGSTSLRTLAKLCRALRVEPWELVAFNPKGRIKHFKQGIQWASQR
jgi:DNA-binding Xre family transcriptional regulator